MVGAGPWPDVATARRFLRGLVGGGWTVADLAVLQRLDLGALADWSVQSGLAPLARKCSMGEFPALADRLASHFYGSVGRTMLRSRELAGVLNAFRAAGIPARWQSGYQTRPNAWNMHDWAEFYVEPWGWLPADVSYGLKASDDQRIRTFYFGHLDSYRLIVNLDYGSHLHPPKESLRSELADFQRGEVEIDGRNLYFDEWDWDFEFETEPLAD